MDDKYRFFSLFAMLLYILLRWLKKPYDWKKEENMENN